MKHATGFQLIFSLTRYRFHGEVYMGRCRPILFPGTVLTEATVVGNSLTPKALPVAAYKTGRDQAGGGGTKRVSREMEEGVARYALVRHWKRVVSRMTSRSQ